MMIKVNRKGNCHSGFIRNRSVAILKNLIDSGQAGKKIRYNVVFMLIMILMTFFFLDCKKLYAQSTRSLVNEGVELYHEKKFSDAEVNFKKGAENDPENFEARFNLGDAYYKQQRYDEALKSFQTALANARNDNEKAKIYHNIGNSFLKSQKIKESIGAYKEALKLNPNDPETKYNLSYALNMLKNQNQQKNKNNQDQNEQNKEQSDQDKQDQQNKNQQQQKQDEQKQQEQPQQQKQKEQEMNKREAERILDALKDNEKELQKQLRKIKGQRVKTEKDW